MPQLIIVIAVIIVVIIAASVIILYVIPPLIGGIIGAIIAWIVKEYSQTKSLRALAQAKDMAIIERKKLIKELNDRKEYILDNLRIKGNELQNKLFLDIKEQVAKTPSDYQRKLVSIYCKFVDEFYIERCFSASVIYDMESNMHTNYKDISLSREFCQNFNEKLSVFGNQSQKGDDSLESCLLLGKRIEPDSLRSVRHTAKFRRRRI